METPGRDPVDAERLWIAKYRAAVDGMPVEQSRPSKMRANVDRIRHVVISQIGKLFTAGGRRHNRSAEAFPVPIQKTSDEKLKERDLQQEAVRKAS